MRKTPVIDGFGGFSLDVGDVIRCMRLTQHDRFDLLTDLVVMGSINCLEHTTGWTGRCVWDKEAYRVCDTGDVIIRIVSIKDTAYSFNKIPELKGVPYNYGYVIEG